MTFSSTVQQLLAASIAAIGMAMTTVGTLGHLPWLAAPGATAIIIGSAWCGEAISRRQVAQGESQRAGKTRKDS